MELIFRRTMARETIRPLARIENLYVYIDVLYYIKTFIENYLSMLMRRDCYDYIGKI